jgi:hypothetical protein
MLSNPQIEDYTINVSGHEGSVVQKIDIESESADSRMIPNDIFLNK